MIPGGLVSITFRQLEPKAIIDLVKQAGLTHIEWGGDVHCPHGDVQTARKVGELTREAGLTPAVYGSYYRTAPVHKEVPAFAEVLDSAQALGAGAIRVWAGDLGSQQSDDAHRRSVIADAQRIADRAAEEGVELIFEYHGGTLSDTHRGAVTLIHDIHRPNVRSGWQPVPTRTHEQNLADLSDLIEREILGSVHVFQWTAGEKGVVRHPLREGENDWNDYLRLLAEAKLRSPTQPIEPPAMIEFVKDNEPDQFLDDGRVLRRWLDAIG